MDTKYPVAVFGDWHGNAGFALMALRSAARAGARTAVHVGDFGLDWPGPKRGRYESKLNKHLQSLGLTLVISGGNHDNWATLTNLAVGEDGTAPYLSNISILPRGGRTVVEGLTVGGLGGAFSVDAEYRTEGKDWWANEEPTKEEAAALIADGPVDLLITHDAPAGVPLRGAFKLPRDLTDRANQTRVLLREVVEALEVPHVLCGHWHQRSTHELELATGRLTRVDVLNMENSRYGNAVLVWPGETLTIEPLEIRGL